MRKMFNLADMFPAGKATHLISDEEMGELFHYLDRLEAEGLEHPVIPAVIHAAAAKVVATARA